MRMQNKAFTLIEILVALIILAIALLAGVKVIGDSANSEINTQKHSIATWVADQLASEIQLGTLDFSNTSSQEGSIQMLGQKWPWKVHVVQGGASAKQMQIQVRDPQSKHVVMSLSTFTPVKKVSG